MVNDQIISGLADKTYNPAAAAIVCCGQRIQYLKGIREFFLTVESQYMFENDKMIITRSKEPCVELIENKQC